MITCCAGSYAAEPLEAYRVGVQIGHYKNNELPPQLSRLVGSTGTYSGGRSEVDLNADVALRLAALLRDQGVLVDVLAATVPTAYTADAFVATVARLSGVPLRAQVASDYAGVIEALRSRRVDLAFVHPVGYVLARREAQPDRFGVALDFGCGVGRLARALSTRFERCYGVDASDEMVEQGSTVVVLSHLEGRTKSGNEIKLPSVEVYRMRDGKANRVQTLTDTAEMKRALGR